MKTYMKRLSNHPGLGMAALMTLFGGLAGIANDSFTTLGGFIFGALVLGGVCWPIVLWTARTQPLPEETHNDH